MRPFCVRCEIAGSIRRRKEEVKDIEIVAVAEWELEKYDLFAEAKVNKLFRWAVSCAYVRWIKPGTSEIINWQPQPTGKYWRGLLPSGIKLDLFIADYSNFGLIYAIRTGSAEFTTALVTHAKRVGLPCVDGHLTRDGKPLETPEEGDVFDLLGLEHVAPHERITYSSLRVRC